MMAQFPRPTIRAFIPLSIILAGLVSAVAGTSAAFAAMSGRVGAVASGGCGSGPFTLTALAGDSVVNLSWCEPLGDPDVPYTGYDVYEGTAAGSENTLVNSRPFPSSVTSYTVTGLADGTTYYFVVYALDNSGGSIVSTEAWATPVGAESAPGAPTGLVATSGDSQVSLSWTPPASQGGSPVTSYNVYQAVSPFGESLGTPVASPTTSSVTISGLTNGTVYYFAVTAVNAIGEGPSGEISAAPQSGPVTQSSSPVRESSSPATRSQSPPIQDTGGANPWPVVLPGAGAILGAAALTLVARRRWLQRQTPSPVPDVRVEPSPGPPDSVTIQTIGPEPTLTVGIVPNRGATTTTLTNI